MLMILGVWSLIRSPRLPSLHPTSKPTRAGFPATSSDGQSQRSQWSISIPRHTDQSCRHCMYNGPWNILSLCLCNFTTWTLVFPLECLMKNIEEISHIPQTGTHHDKTHTRLMLWFKWNVQLCLTRNHLEQVHCFGLTQTSRGTNEHAKIQQSWRHFWVFTTLLWMSKLVQEQNAQRVDLIPDPFEICAVKYLLPLLPTEPQKTHYLWKYTAKFTGSAGLASSAGLAADFKSRARWGFLGGKQHSLHSTFLMGCNQEHVGFKPISEPPALNPNSFFKVVFVKLKYKNTLCMANNSI